MRYLALAVHRMTEQWIASRILVAGEAEHRTVVEPVPDRLRDCEEDQEHDGEQNAPAVGTVVACLDSLFFASCF